LLHITSLDEFSAYILFPTFLLAPKARLFSYSQGGNFGEFSLGQMVWEFDEVVFGNEVGKVHGPIKTQFEYHLIEITSRTT